MPFVTLAVQASARVEELAAAQATDLVLAVPSGQGHLLHCRRWPKDLSADTVRVPPLVSSIDGTCPTPRDLPLRVQGLMFRPLQASPQHG